MSQRKPDVLIIGAGVIGSACAYYLTKRGARVTLIDKGAVGHECSYGNAGWIVPCHAMPLPQPGAMRMALKRMLRPDSPLYIKPRLDWDMTCWLMRFLRSANQRHLTYAAPVLIELGKHSLRLFEEFVASENVADVCFEKKGLLYVCATRSGLEHSLHESQIACACGINGREMTEAELRAFQPCVTGPIVGGVYFQSEAHIEPLRAVQAMARLAEAGGAVILPQSEVFDIETDGRRIITGVRTTRGTLTADQYVLAMGSWTPVLAKRLSLNVPIQAGKGYALIVEPPFDPPPTAPMLLVEKKVAVTPRNGSVRLAGTMELGGLDESITPLRVDAIARGAREFLNLPHDLKVTETWRGLRPCTPDGLPIISRAPKWDNLTIAAGHAMLGLTLATGTGRLVADMLTGEPSVVDPTPFRASRF
jgi:D-amino-acid dehydrogenase